MIFCLHGDLWKVKRCEYFCNVLLMLGSFRGTGEEKHELHNEKILVIANNEACCFIWGVNNYSASYFFKPTL